MTDIRLVLRGLVATPVITAAALLSLALGIGVNTFFRVLGVRASLGRATTIAALEASRARSR